MTALTDFIAWIQTPPGIAFMSAAGTALLAILHALGVNIPILSLLLDTNSSKPRVGTDAANTAAPGAAVTPLVVSGSIGDSIATAQAQANPLFAVIASLLSKLHGLPAAHPAIQTEAAKTIAVATSGKSAPVVPPVVSAPVTVVS